MKLVDPESRDVGATSVEAAEKKPNLSLARPTTLMNPLSTRIRKRRAPQRQQPDRPQTLSVLRRPSSQIQSRLRSCYKFQSPLEQPPTNPQTSQPVGAASGPVEVPAPVPQSQEYPGPPQTRDDQTRKRRSDQPIEASAKRPLKRALLTKKNLKEFEKMGKQKRLARKWATGQSASLATTSDTKSTWSKPTTSTTESGFQDIAFENGILNPRHSKPHANLKQSKDQINRTRDTVSPSESEYDTFCRKIGSAPNEQTLVQRASHLFKEYGTDDSGYSRVYNQAFTTFPKNVGFNNGLLAAQPDMVEGLEMPEFHPFPVRQELGGAAVPTLGTEAVTLPHLAGEWKGPGKNMISAQTQAAYDGACMVYARNQALSFLDSSDPPSHAFISTFTTDGTILQTYAHYASSDANGQIKYHQYPTSSSFLTSSFDDYKTSRRRLRNLQDCAKEASEKLRDELNKKWYDNQCLDNGEGEGGDGQESYELGAAAASIPAETADATDCDYDDRDDPDDQLIKEYRTDFTANNQDESFVPIPTTDNGYTTRDAVTSPPQSSKDTSLPLAPNGDIYDSNVRGHKRTRRTRTRAADTIEGTTEADPNLVARNTRRKR